MRERKILNQLFLCRPMKSCLFQEMDIVRVRVSLRSEGIEKGECGKVVMIYGNPPKDVDVEFLDPETGNVKLVMVPLRWIELIEVPGNTDLKDDSLSKK